MVNEQHTETGKHIVDAASGLAVFSTLVGWLPSITAFVSLIWVSMRIYETYLNIQAQKRLRDADK